MDSVDRVNNHKNINAPFSWHFTWNFAEWTREFSIEIAVITLTILVTYVFLSFLIQILYCFLWI